jgi:dienelactone hydrolase
MIATGFRPLGDMLRHLCFLMIALVVSVSVLAQESAPNAAALPAGARYVEREFRLPVPDSFPNGLDALEVYVDTPGKHPLALLTHGTSDKPEERMQLTPWAQVPQALWFARRGYVVLVIIRRGYGISGGKQDSTFGGCRPGGSFQEAGQAAADDLRAAVNYAEKQMPEADASQVVSAGVSTGGFTQVALAAKPPAGLKAAISFAGGRGGDGKGHLCDESGVVSAFKSFGKHARIPMLWIYAENDKWFPPEYAKQFQAAYEGAGGTDEFVLAPPDGEDGHHLYTHVAAWSKTVDDFLGRHNLLPLAEPYPMPTPPQVTAPAGLSERGQEAFRNFLIYGPNKAFATNGQAVFGFSIGQFTQGLADERAMQNCEHARHEGPPCAIVSRGK